MESFLRAGMALFAILLIMACSLRISTWPLDEAAVESGGRVQPLFSFRDPVALFFPTATISLTDDNSTFFNAKPAAFGPSLPLHGLSGQIWIGTGFGDAAHNHRGFSVRKEGELGCDDVPEWLRASQDSLRSRDATQHEQADDVAGKIALLSRGGCGFSEKVEWAQKRGATAVIIGDNVPGGPLVRMYARDDISNVTIPSVFTSHTTAHLLSSLIPHFVHSGLHGLVDANGEILSSEGISSHAISRDEESATLDQFSGIFGVHEGLWVTLTQADMSASPFFNTLFVLVVSPLFTLAIVYSMLLLRSRIRRRRWRAPKSVVERLPVRVYQSLSSRESTACGTPQQETVSSTTPLLQHSTSGGVETRQQHFMSNGLASSPPSSSQYGSMEHSAVEKEKIDAGLAEWRRKYCGKQRECVVCLDEYVDGVSRVMSLPCGHEFHADCITPWLTTRRRTCPICKGDVVRSLGKDAEQGERDASDETEEEVQIQAAETVNSSPSAALPVPPPSTSRRRDGQRGESSSSTFSSFGSPLFWSSRHSLWAIRGAGRRAPHNHDLEDRNERYEEPDRS